MVFGESLKTVNPDEPAAERHNAYIFVFEQIPPQLCEGAGLPGQPGGESSLYSIRKVFE